LASSKAPGKRVGVGDAAPDFTLPDRSGAPVRLHDLTQQGTVVLYFYPKDNTRGCTAEACAFRDSYEAFTDAGARVVGVSADSAASHDGFAGRYGLPFVLLSDRENAVRRLYGVPKTLGLLPGRVTFVIDRAGVVRHVFSSQIGATKHVDEALHVVRKLHEAGPASAASKP
jgi:peroxiredoxin Q/BCP